MKKASKQQPLQHISTAQKSAEHNRPKKIESYTQRLRGVHGLVELLSAKCNVLYKHRNHVRSTYHLLILRFRADKYLLLKRPYHIYEMKQGNEYMRVVLVLKLKQDQQ